MTNRNFSWQLIGIVSTVLFLSGCVSTLQQPDPTAIPTEVPTAAPAATLSGEEAAALEKVARSVISGADPQPCSQCHTIGRVAFGKVGPDLSDIGARADEAYIRESIVDPPAVIAENCPGGPCPTDVDAEGGMSLLIR